MNRTKSAPVIRAARDGRTIEMRAVAWNVLDDHRTTFVPGFGVKALARRLPRLAWAHSWDEPIGKVTSYDNRSDGLYMTARLSDPDAVPRARQAMAQLADGTIDSVSIGFRITESRVPSTSERERMPGLREVIVDGEISEVSLCLEGSVPGAEVLAVRRRDGGAAPVPFTDLDALAERMATEILRHGSMNDSTSTELRDLLDEIDRRGLARGRSVAPARRSSLDEILRARGLR